MKSQFKTIKEINNFIRIREKGCDDELEFDIDFPERKGLCRKDNICPYCKIPLDKALLVQEQTRGIKEMILKFFRGDSEYSTKIKRLISKIDGEK